MNVTGKPSIVVRVEVPGSVVASAADVNEVTVDSKMVEPDQLDFAVSQNANQITITSRAKSWNPLIWGAYLFSGGPRTDITIQVPHESDLRIETMTDPITVSGIKGSVESTSKTGNIQVSESSGGVSVETHTGAVNLSNVNGIVSVRATTGSVRYSGTPSSNGESSFRSTTGDVDITLLGSNNLKVDAATTIGKITCAMNMQDSRYEKGQYVGHHITGRIGSESQAGRLTVDTTVGSISIH